MAIRKKFGRPFRKREDPRNAQAIKLLEALGFQREGLLRERWIVGNLKSDSAFYGLLRGDWLRKQEFSPRGVA
jgi:hypothetical protein